MNEKVVRLVDKVVKQTWKNASAVADAMRVNSEKQVRIVITPLKQQIALLKENILESVETLVKNFIVEASSKLCRPLLATASESIARAYAAVIRSLYAYVTEQYVNAEGMTTTDTAGGGCGTNRSAPGVGASSSLGAVSSSASPGVGGAGGSGSGASTPDLSHGAQSSPQPQSAFSRFVENAHIAIDSDWMPMVGPNAAGFGGICGEGSRSIVGVAANSDMSFPSRGACAGASASAGTGTSNSNSASRMSASAASLLPHRSSSLGNFHAMHANHLLFNSKRELDELRMYNGGFTKVEHVFSAGFTSKDAINIIVEQVCSFS